MSGKRQRRKLDGVVQRRTCTAHTRDGTPCKNAPILGGTVCRMHGGAAPQVRARADARLINGVPTMLTELRRIAIDESVPAPTRLAAIRDWLDRAGIGENAKHEVTINLPRFQENLEDLIVGFDDIVDADVVEESALEADANYDERHPMERRFPEGQRLTVPRDPDAPPTYTSPTP